ncbi:hypothetical protein BDZ97DRAFT_2073490 [Flammula alnicola]|nr:hypothetical protein BDZ97DRAFT_2073490 [Flammula alnicola]
MYLDIVNPNFIPRNSYDLCTLAGHYRKAMLMQADAVALADMVLSMPVNEISGVKPRPGDKHASICPIPDSKISLRLWPAWVSRREFCLDFVDSDTREPVNSPPGFDLYSAACLSEPGYHRSPLL